MFTVAQLEERIRVIEKVRESWKGNSGYIETVNMEIWAMSLIARLMRRSVAELEAAEPDLAADFDKDAYARVILEQFVDEAEAVAVDVMVADQQARPKL